MVTYKSGEGHVLGVLLSIAIPRFLEARRNDEKNPESVRRYESSASLLTVQSEALLIILRK